MGIFGYDSEIVPYLNESIETNSGIYVATVSRYGPAYMAGIKTGDVILSVDGIEINKMIELREYIYNKSPNDKVVLKILRGKETFLVTAILGKK